MWRILHAIGRGLRSVRPSQIYSQDCSGEGHSKFTTAPAATLKHYSASPRSYDIIKKNTKSLHDAILPREYSYSEGIHTRSYGRENYVTEEGHTCYPWHWHILQDHQTQKRSYSKKKHNHENTDDDWQANYSQEWKEIIQSSPTLHALGWGSAVALTWSLYHDWRKHHPCPYWANYWQQQKKTNKISKKQGLNSNKNVMKKDTSLDRRSEGNLWENYEFLQSFFNTYPQEQGSEVTKNEGKYRFGRKERGKKILERQHTSLCKVTYQSELKKKINCPTQNATEPSYSLQQNLSDQQNTNAGNHLVGNVNEDYHFEERTCSSDSKIYEVGKFQFFSEDGYCEEDNKIDSGCISDLSQSFKLSASNSLDEICQDKRCNKIQNCSTDKTEVTTGHKTSGLVTSDSELETEEQRCYYNSQATTPEDFIKNYVEDIRLKLFCDKFLKILEPSSEDQLPEVLKEDVGKCLVDTKPEEAVVYFQAGALIGDPASTFNLALCYHMGHGITKDLKKARELYKAATAAGHGSAMYNLAVMMSQGLGGPVLFHQAYGLLLQAKKMGVTEAQQALSALEEQQQQQIIKYEAGETTLSHSHSEPSIPSAFTKEWLTSSYSTGDLLYLLQENEWTLSDLSTDIHISERVKPWFYV